MYFHPDGAPRKGAPRKIGPETAVLAMLIYEAKKYAYRGLGYMFGTQKSTMFDTVTMVENTVAGDLTGRLFCMYPPERIEPHIPEAWKKQFPGAFCAGDGFPLPCLMNEKFVVRKLTWCVYKNGHIFLVVGCKSDIHFLVLYSRSYTLVTGFSPDGIM